MFELVFLWAQLFIGLREEEKKHWGTRGKRIQKGRQPETVPSQQEQKNAL